MRALFFIYGIAALIISSLFASLFFKHYKKEHINRITNWMSVIFFGYFSLFILSFLWLFDFLSYSPKDFNFIYSFVVFVQTLILFKVAYSFKKEKSVLYLLVFYLISLAAILLSFPSLSLLILAISFFLTLILSFSFISSSEKSKNDGYVLALYSCISLIFEFLLLLDIGEAFLFSLISNFIFLIFIAYFLKDVEKYPLKSSIKIHITERPYLLVFMRYFIFIVVLVNFVLISTIGIHELSHVLVSRAYGCESRTILYEEGRYPYSEIVCDDLSGKFFITFAGSLIPILVGLLLFFLGGSFIRPVSFLIIGFNLVASFRDFKEIGFTDNIIFATLIFGGIFLFMGLVFVSRFMVREHPHTSFA